MAEENRRVCESCKYFSHGLSENGYCRLYHHNLSMPERICSRYEPKQENAANKTTDTEAFKPKIKSTYRRHLSYSIGVVSSIIIIIAALLIDVVFAVELFQHPIALPVKIGTLAVVISGFLIFLWHILTLLRRNRWLYIPYMLVSVSIILLVLFDFGNMWIKLNGALNIIIDFIFYDIHNL